MGIKLKLKRVEAGLSQKALAEKSGVSRTTIANLETGKRTETRTDTLKRLAEALGCTVKDIFF